jgi:hypothetical protein
VYKNTWPVSSAREDNMKEFESALDILEGIVERISVKTGHKSGVVFDVCREYIKEHTALLESQRGTKEERMAIDHGIEELYTHNPMLEMTAKDFMEHVNVRRNDSNRQYFYTNKRKFLLIHGGKAKAAE